MTWFGDLNLKFQLILAVSVFLNFLKKKKIHAQQKLSMRKVKSKA